MKLLLDTGALIVAFQETIVPRRAGEVERHDRHRNILLPCLNAYSGPYIVPTIVFSEFSFGLRTDGEKQYANAKFPSKFRLVPLTTRIAMIATDMREKLLEGTTEEEYLAECDSIKRAFRADLYIMATSFAEKCEQIVTRDDRMKKHANRLKLPLIHIDDLGKTGMFKDAKDDV